MSNFEQEQKEGQESALDLIRDLYDRTMDYYHAVKGATKADGSINVSDENLEAAATKVMKIREMLSSRGAEFADDDTISMMGSSTEVKEALYKWRNEK